ncbi:uncharacterized protein N7483_005411 [Penicillium malachiteum]|uniref:uncharacterized protein n=1 Tax=Penicillium malachiteum TaxID=1324776 RepID=UPI002546F145|nr:uncharacterized protein N7483_005411 [Penicillium malachiteum]KAJ5730903.1 hypothetical protein N7483_005411 [Penicillium malachiteum]
MGTHVPVPVNVLNRRFLRMDLPVYECIPEVELQAGIQYPIPFHFVVPIQLPVQFCPHKCMNIQVNQEHLNLPASLGHTDRFFDNAHDMAPKEAKISYAITFTIRNPGGKNKLWKKTREYKHPIYILPKASENAPILIPPDSWFYQLNAQKALKKGIFQPSVGSLSASTFQPPAIELSGASQSQNTAKLSTTLKVNLAFEPANPDSMLPRSIFTKVKLKAMTFFGVEPWEDFPDLTHPGDWDTRRAYWSDSVPVLSDEIVPNWSLCIRSDDGEMGKRTVYTASMEILVTLPTSRVYPPTFHSCFISRVYSLSANFSFRPHKTGKRGSNIILAAPVQIVEA